MKILPASSGIQELNDLTRQQQVDLLTQLDAELDVPNDGVDYLLIDTAPGISANVMDLNAAAHERIVVVSPEPTSITDAYALMKVLSLKYPGKGCKLLVNRVSRAQEGREVFRQMRLVTERFLDINIEYLGAILEDGKALKAVKNQKLVSELYPETEASRGFRELAREVSATSAANSPQNGSLFFMGHLVPE